MSEEDFDPFADVVDEQAMSPHDRWVGLLASAKRGYAPLRKVAVQRPRGSDSRAAALAELVHHRQERALDALLLLHALQPILSGSPLPLSTWAALLSSRRTCTSAAASRAFDELAKRKLVMSSGGRLPVIDLLHEDQSGRPWTRPGVVDDIGHGYFALPYEYWTDRYVERLTLPGKAMLLILLAETQDPKKPTFSMAVERAQDWYGISERTAERGYSQLSQCGVLLVKVQKVADPRHPAGRREVYHRALATPFGTLDRLRLQRAAAKAARIQAPATPTAATKNVAAIGAASTE